MNGKWVGNHGGSVGKFDWMVMVMGYYTGKT